MHGGTGQSLGLHVDQGEVSPEASDALGPQGVEVYAAFLAQQAPKHVMHHLSDSNLPGTRYAAKSVTHVKPITSKKRRAGGWVGAWVGGCVGVLVGRWDRYFYTTYAGTRGGIIGHSRR